MKTKIFGFALLLSLAGFLGACGENPPAPDSTAPTTTTTTPAEPTDSGTTPPASPTATPTTSPASPAPTTP